MPIIPNIPHYTFAPYNKFNNTYALTEKNVTDLNNWLTLPELSDLWDGLFKQEPFENITSLVMYPFNIYDICGSGIYSNIYIANQDTGIVADSMGKILWNCLVPICNERIYPIYNNFLDFYPYTKIEIYLPYMGFLTLPTNEFMNKVLTVQYMINFTNGTCEIFISSDGVLKIITEGIIGQQIPIGSTNYRSIANNVFKTGMSTIAGVSISPITSAPMLNLDGGWYFSNVASKSTSGLVNGTVDMINSIQIENMTKGTSGGAFPSFYLPQNCYLIITSPTVEEPSTYSHTIGKPAGYSSQLKDLDGFTVIKSVHVEGISALDSELKEIETLLLKGVILDAETSIVRINTPVLTNLSTEDECKFSFENDTRAYAYKVFVNDVQIGYPYAWEATLENNVYTVTLNNNAFKDGAGDYTITVQGYSNNSEVEDSFISDPITYTLLPLDSPVISLSETSDKFPNGSLLTISPVEKATGYKIFSNDSYIFRPDESILIYDMSDSNLSGTYKIYVIAYNDVVESPESNSVDFIVSLPKLNPPVISLSNTSNKYPNGSLLTITPVENATGYKIFSNDSYIFRPDESVLTYDMSTATLVGEYSMYVIAYDSNGNYYDSNASNTVNFIVQEPTQNVILYTPDTNYRYYSIYKRYNQPSGDVTPKYDYVVMWTNATSAKLSEVKNSKTTYQCDLNIRNYGEYSKIYNFICNTLDEALEAIKKPDTIYNWQNSDILAFDIYNYNKGTYNTEMSFPFTNISNYEFATQVKLQSDISSPYWITTETSTSSVNKIDENEIIEVQP